MVVLLPPDFSIRSSRGGKHRSLSFADQSLRSPAYSNEGCFAGLRGSVNASVSVVIPGYCAGLPRRFLLEFDKVLDMSVEHTGFVASETVLTSH
jgi:hypothetical protein